MTHARRRHILAAARKQAAQLHVKLDRIYINTIELLGFEDQDSIVFDYLNNGGNTANTVAIITGPTRETKKSKVPESISVE